MVSGYLTLGTSSSARIDLTVHIHFGSCTCHFVWRLEDAEERQLEFTTIAARLQTTIGFKKLAAIYFTSISRSQKCAVHFLLRAPPASLFLIHSLLFLLANPIRSNPIILENRPLLPKASLRTHLLQGSPFATPSKRRGRLRSKQR